MRTKTWTKTEGIPCWTCLGLRKVQIPYWGGKVTIYADSDPTGEISEAAGVLAERLRKKLLEV